MDHRENEPATKEDLREVDQKLTTRIDQVEQRLTGRIDQVEQKLTSRIDDVEQKLTARIEENSRKIDRNSDQINRLAIEVLNNREQIEKRATREELNQRFDEVIRGQDKMMAILTRIDQERVATTARIDRIEGDVESLKAR